MLFCGLALGTPNSFRTNSKTNETMSLQDGKKTEIIRGVRTSVNSAYKILTNFYEWTPMKTQKYFSKPNENNKMAKIKLEHISVHQNINLSKNKTATSHDRH